MGFCYRQINKSATKHDHLKYYLKCGSISRNKYCIFSLPITSDPLIQISVFNRTFLISASNPSLHITTVSRNKFILVYLAQGFNQNWHQWYVALPLRSRFLPSRIISSLSLYTKTNSSQY